MQILVFCDFRVCQGSLLRNLTDQFLLQDLKIDDLGLNGLMLCLDRGSLRNKTFRQLLFSKNGSLEILELVVWRVEGHDHILCGGDGVLTRFEKGALVLL